jgi:phage-related protein
MYDIDIHQLNLGPFINLFILDEIPFKILFYLHLFNNKCILISFFKKKTTTISKRGMGIALFF